jgi:hypothetical protein
MTGSTIETKMAQKIQKLTKLPNVDKIVLLEALEFGYGNAQRRLPDLSIFISNSVERERTDIYDNSTYRGVLYYSSVRNKDHSGVFFDQFGKLLFSGRYYLSHLNAFLDCIDNCLDKISTYRIENAIDVGKNYVSIEKWFVSYGHFKDELYSLANFLSTSDEYKNYRPFFDFPSDDFLNTEKFIFNPNYTRIKNLIFEDNYLNTYDCESTLVRLENLVLIENRFDSLCFHSFPAQISNKIKNKVLPIDIGFGPKRVFLTRSSSYRDIHNKFEVERFFSENGFLVINPESISYDDLLYYLKDVNFIAMYYGSAMTNLVYAPAGANVYVLKAESYANENLNLWKKMIEEYKLNFLVINSIENKILDADIDFVKTLI